MMGHSSQTQPALDFGEPTRNLAIVMPWERQPDDTDKAFEAFEIYRQMGYGRQMRKVAAQLKKTEDLIHRWSKRDHWEARVQAYDRYEARMINARVIAGTASMRERQIALAMQMQSRASNRILRMTQPEIDSMNITDVCSLMKAAADIERKAREVPVDELGGEGMILPKYEIRFYSPGSNMVAAHTADGRYGWIPESRIEEFRDRFPGAVVIC